eukprot:TRINITY_DN2856_c0_g2_i1.p1 TRINITY_DN2856_c0_g2~~TRINITY_DN2856_c0_g2_i1.p1  ORF type:complete len:706 (-),score=158.77 TRINITY_DN2856_c0_g2_i1:106-2223(-)
MEDTNNTDNNGNESVGNKDNSENQTHEDKREEEVVKSEGDGSVVQEAIRNEDSNEPKQDDQSIAPSTSDTTQNDSSERSENNGGNVGVHVSHDISNATTQTSSEPKLEDSNASEQTIPADTDPKALTSPEVGSNLDSVKNNTPTRERMNSFGVLFVSGEANTDTQAQSAPTTPVQPPPTLNDKNDTTNTTPTPETIPTPTVQPSSNHIYDHFVVVGLPPSYSEKTSPLKPQILFQFPHNVPVPPKVVEFCFPSTVSVSTIRRTPSCSQLNEVVYAQSHLHHSRDSHIFVLTLDDAFLYGVCVTRMEFVKSIPSFFKSDPSSFPHPLPKLDSYEVAPRCYCILSKYPYFPLHYDTILTLLAQDRIVTLTKEMSAATEVISKFRIEDINSTSPPKPPQIEPPKPNPVEEKDNPEVKSLIAHLEKSYLQELLKPGQTVTLQLPGQSKARTFLTPTTTDIEESNAKLLAEWALVPFCMGLSLDNFLRIFAASLQECKIVFVVDNLNLLSSALLSMIPLLYPFVWQGIYVPILPIPLQELLDAPVPFLVGVQSLQKSHTECIVVDLKNDRITYQNCDPPPPLPEQKKLHHNLKGDYSALYSPSQSPVSPSNVSLTHNPFNNTPQQVAHVKSILHTIQSYIFWLVRKIEGHYESHPPELSDSLSIEAFKNSFLAIVSPQNKAFVKGLLDTQHFSTYLHNHMGKGTPKQPFT